MGQSATLYRIDRKDFSKILDNPIGFELFTITKGYEIFEKSFEGLQFVLSKGLDDIDKLLVEQIFYPKTFVGEQIDFSTVDFENFSDDIDIEQQELRYNDPEKVLEIHQLISTITLATFRENFDANELNKEDIYPGDIWNDRDENDMAFNVGHLTLEFQNLKSIFEKASDNGEYLLSYVG